MYYPPKPTRIWPGSNIHDVVLNDSRWIAEPKADGDRCIVVAKGGQVELWSRHGRQHSYSWINPLREELLSLCLVDGTILDCELLHEPKPRCQLMVFDIPSVDGTLLERREALERICLTDCKYAFIAKWMNKSTAYTDALADGQEGVVYKRTDSRYQWQRSDSSGNEVPYWLKMKPVKL